jgi:predicted aconitase
MQLTDQEKGILDGKHGEGARIALSILVDLGELFGAGEMMEVSQVHSDSSIYFVDAGLEFAERLAELGAKVTVPTSLNPSAIDLERWKEYRVPPELLEKSRRMERAYLNMGATPTWTCAPYQGRIEQRRRLKRNGWFSKCQPVIELTILRDYNR